MTKGTKIFRITISVLLALIIAWGAFMTYGFMFFAKNYIHRDAYGIWIAGVSVTRANKDDILGDGKVSYNAYSNMLTFDNAVIEFDYTIIYSQIDLSVNLIGENKFICKDGKSITAIYASDYILRKDLSFDGDGSLTIEYQNVTESGTGIVAEDLWVGCDITVTTPDGVDIANGIICTSSLILRNKAALTVNNGSARSSTAVSVRGNAIIESGSSLDVAVNSGSTEACNGVCVDGNLVVGKDAAVNVSVDDEIAQIRECIGVSGIMSIGRNATVTASSKKTYAIKCYGTMETGEGATLTSSNAGEGADIFCYSTFVNEGAVVNAEINALGGIYYNEDLETNS